MGIESLKQINQSIENFAQKNKLNDATYNRVVLLAEEALSFLIEHQSKGDKKSKKNIIFKLYHQADITELEFISKPIGVNAESAAIALKDIGEVDFEKKLSLKLLYGLTQELKHLQYHGIDYLYLKVGMMK